MSDSPRVLQPMILQTKEELLTALRNGQLKTSKYNLLSENEKLFVELVCFGGYTGEQAIKAIDPTIRAPQAAANRLMANPAVSDTIEELTVAKDKRFTAEVQSARDMALRKLSFIMNTTDDPTLAVSCAKIIMDKAEAMSKTVSANKDEPVGEVRFNIKVDNVYMPGATTSKPEEPVIIELTPEEMEPEMAKLTQENKELVEKNKLLRAKAKEPVDSPAINPDTGLPYTLVYEGVDNYTKKDGE